MRWLLLILALATVALAGLSIWVRTRSVPDARIVYPDQTWEPGNHVTPGGFIAVRRVDDPEAAFRRLTRIVLDTPRTRRRDGGPEAGRMIAVTRSAVMGFPDITQIWTRDDLLLIRGHLVIGRADVGVNRRRILEWLDQAGLPVS